MGSLNLIVVPSNFNYILSTIEIYSWSEQSDDVFEALAGDFMKPRILEVDELLNLGLNVTIYSGQVSNSTLLSATPTFMYGSFNMWIYRFVWSIDQLLDVCQHVLPSLHPNITHHESWLLLCMHGTGTVSCFSCPSGNVLSPVVLFVRPRIA